MIDITLPDGSHQKYNQSVTPYEVAENLAKSLAKKAVVAKVNGQLQDLYLPIEEDSKLEIITEKDEEALEVIRHDAAHIMAEAVKELYPETQVTIGPAIEYGFYYDFARDKPFNTEDLKAIEKRMEEISKRNEEIKREVWDRDEAIKFFRDMGEHYKADIIAEIPQDQPVTMYRQGGFIDLCKGPHSPSTGKIKHFKLMKIAGAYWRGDSDNEMLQRIYGTAWSSKQQLEDYLHMLEEAEKRDHRKLGKELDLFHIQDEARGLIFWHHKGWTLVRLLEEYIRNKLHKSGYTEVSTPLLASEDLWHESGHIQKFGDDMFSVKLDDKDSLCIKPMNCPLHVQIFKDGVKSYRDLPIRMAEFGSCHRNESSGSLHGLMRVRGFIQDDAHIFCTEEQITKETVDFCNLLIRTYKDFGFDDISVKFSDRPETRAGSDEIWNKAEQALESAVQQSGLPYSYNPGEGAFYGPKLEFVLKDALGRQWQCGTLQADFVLPERLDANYIDEHGKKQRPVMLHRAIFGSIERFTGVLIEEYAGKFPLWLAPVQVAIATVTNHVDDYAKSIYHKLINSGVRTDLDISSEKINYKIRKFSTQKVPLILAIGKQEREDETVNVRRFGSNEQEIMTIDQLLTEINNANKILK